MAASTLPPLPAITQLRPALIRLLGHNPGKFSLQGTNTYLVGTGRKRLLIDTGEGKPEWIASLRSTLAAQNAALQAVLITHWHHDHTHGIPDVLAAFPGTPVYKEDPAEGQSPIADGQVFSVEGATLRAAHAPGHTSDHVVFVWEEEDAMFTGDCVLGHGTAVFENLSEYLTSLGRMGGLFKGRAYPGHGEVIEDGPGRIQEYLRHRQVREDQVVKTLSGDGKGRGKEGGWELMEVVRVMYRDVDEALHTAAARGVLQILDKLSDEGRVSEEAGRWRLVGVSGNGNGRSVL